MNTITILSLHRGVKLSNLTGIEGINSIAIPLLENVTSADYVLVYSSVDRESTKAHNDMYNLIRMGSQTMIQVPAKIVEKTCMKGDLFVIPDNVKSAIENCLVNDSQDLIIEEYHKLVGEYKTYRNLITAAKINYESDLRLDAYVTFYLPRNMIIPWIAIRDLSLHPNFQNLSDEVNVLDLGSGTGAIVLGLLHLFKSEALSRVVINIAALDCQTKALARQKDLLMAAGFDLGHVHLLEADLNNVDDCVRKADKYSPFSFIFAGNCLTELGYQKSIDLISRLSLELVGDGAIIIAEAQRDYVKKMVAILARGVEDFGLHVYYPCPGAARCTHSYCWVWRDHDYDFPGLQICGKPLSEYPKDKLTLSWLVLTRQDISIYDSFKREKPGLFWGPIARQKYWDGEKRIDSLGFCDGEQITICDKDYRVSSRYRRGSIVGISKDHKIERYHEL